MTSDKQPRGRPPMGCTWDGECFRREDGSKFVAKYKKGAEGQPRGRPPSGCSWDVALKSWVNKDGTVFVSKTAAVKSNTTSPKIDPGIPHVVAEAIAVAVAENTDGGDAEPTVVIKRGRARPKAKGSSAKKSKMEGDICASLDAPGAQ